VIDPFFGNQANLAWSQRSAVFAGIFMAPILGQLTGEHDRHSVEPHGGLFGAVACFAGVEVG